MPSLRSARRAPTHPGAVLREDVLPALNITQTELAERLHVSRLTVSELLHERRALSADLSVRLATLLNTTPERWLQMQTALDVNAQRSRRARAVRPLSDLPRFYTTDALPPELQDEGDED